MKNAKLNLITLLITLFTSLTGAIAQTYVPSTQRSMSSDASYCVGDAPNDIRFRYFTCNSGSGSATGATMTIAWYRNTVNSTTGGTLLTSSSGSSVTSSSGSLFYTPSTAVQGVNYFYCVLTWTGSGTCNTSGTLTSSTTMVTVTASAGAIGGSSTPCVGATTTYTNSATGGVWSTSSSARATIGSTTGILTGVSAGTVYITYETSCGSPVARLVTVTATPTVASITGGTVNICAGSTTSFSNSTSGGAWTSSNTAVATVGTSGVVSGVAAGTSTISYAVTNSCGTTNATRVVTVNPLPSVAAISGTGSVCMGATTTLSNATSGGVWTSSSTGIATVSAGVVTPVAAGTATISYSVTNGCGTTHVTRVVTVNALPAAITGTATLCQGTTTTLSNATAGGSWTSGNTSVASVGSGTGIVTGVAGGTSSVTYTTTAGCIATRTVTVTAAPVVTVPANQTICNGATQPTLSFTSSISGTTYVWTNSNASIGLTGTSTGTMCGTATENTNLVLTAPAGAVFTGVTFASYGTPTGSCGSFATSSCHAASSLSTVSSYVVGQSTVTIPATNAVFGDPCSGTFKRLYVQATFSYSVIPSFTAVNTGASAVVATVTVTPTLNGCSGTPGTFTITVDPTPTAYSVTGGGSYCSTGAGVAIGLGGSQTGVNYQLKLGASNVGSAIAGTGSAISFGTFTTVGTYSVSASTATASCTASMTGSATITSGTSSPITGTLTVCAGSTTTLGNAVGGGTWTSSNATIATVGSASGVVSGVAQGTATITYTSGSCSTTSVVTVNPLPVAGSITGSASVCVSSVSSLSSTESGGEWSSSATSIATVSGGDVSGVAAGTATISYTVTNGCGSAIATRVVTVNPLPGAGTISGTAVVCASATTTLSSTVGGGVWSSSNTAVATVGTDGVVSGVASGNATISYAVTNSCGTANATQVVTVNPLPAVGTISGTAVVCQSATTTLSSTVGGGVWSSSNTAVATVGTSGVVSGVAAGTSTISYTVTNSCGTANATQVVTVNPLPAAGTISGTAVVCESATTTLSSTVGGGVWSSSNAAVATVGTDGVVSGVAAGNATISYAVTNSCGTANATQVVTVNPLPAAGTISGTAVVCESATTTLNSTVGGGVWSSSNTAVATVGTDGVVSGVAAGNATISYAVTNSCGTANATQVVTVNPLPGAGTISGSNDVCLSSTTDLTNSVSGGAWTSSNAGVASVSTAGVVTGVSLGAATITYTHTTSCGTAFVTHGVTVNTVPSFGAISGPNTVCASSTITLSNSVSGGVWSSSNTTVATVGTDGVVSGVAGGTATISYGGSNFCGTNFVSVVVSVNPSSATITGDASVCLGGSTTYTVSDAAGAWSSSATGVASIVASTGLINGLSIGSVVVSYTATSGCYVATQTLSVFNSVAEITGTVFACEGVTSALSCATAGGSWSTSNASIASVNASGVVSAVSAGSATITYTLASGCYTTTTFVVWPMPAPITGVQSVCTGSSTVLYSTIGGAGTWSTSDVSIATADLTSGMINGVTAGTTVVTYRIPASGCQVTTVVTVNETPASITGSNTICVGSTTVYSSATTGGTWSTNPSSVATIDGTTGMATAATAGVTTVSYVMPTGCFVTRVITANPLPASITFSANNICLGKTMTFASTTAGGTWSSSNTSVATIASSGVATTQDLGTTNIIYTLSTGCSRTTTLSVFSGVSSISGADIVARGSSITLSNATTGGTWSSGNTSIISANSVTGVVTGMSAGSARISYRLLGGCLTYKVMTVAGITGTPNACVGSTTTLSHLMAGTWTSANPSIATIGATTGVVTGIAPGNAVISYNLGGGVFNTVTVVVNPLPAAITGSSTLCADASSLYTGTVGGSATWSSSTVSVVTIGSTSGMATGVSVGTSTLTYRIPSSGCFTTRTITVNPAPAAITGSSTACVGATVTLSNAVAGGTWSSNPTTVATIGSTTGVVSATSAGGVTISYTLSNGCRKTRVITVNAAPAAITGPATLSPGSASAFTCGTAGGSWSVSDAAIATILTASGASANVRAVAAGVANLVFTLTNGCSRSRSVSVVGAKAAPVAEEVMENSFNVYPNPTSGIINVESSVAGSFSVYTFDGKEVSEYQIGANTTTVSLPAGLASGIYICQFRFEDGTYKTVKLFYQN